MNLKRKRKTETVRLILIVVSGLLVNSCSINVPMPPPNVIVVSTGNQNEPVHIPVIEKEKPIIVPGEPVVEVRTQTIREVVQVGCSEFVIPVLPDKPTLTRLPPNSTMSEMYNVLADYLEETILYEQKRDAVLKEALERHRATCN